MEVEQKPATGRIQTPPLYILGNLTMAHRTIKIDVAQLVQGSTV